MNDAFVGSLIFNRNSGGGASAMSDLTDVNLTGLADGDSLVYNSTSSKWVNGQGGGKQTALTQAEYDALVQAGTVDPTVEYFITDGIPANGGGGAYRSELIWDYVNDNSNIIPFGLYNVTLNESIDDYDALYILFKSDYNDSGNWGNSSPLYIDINAIKNNPFNPNHLNYTSFDDRSSGFYLSGTTLQKIIDNRSDTNGLIAVYGIKY